MIKEVLVMILVSNMVAKFLSGIALFSINNCCFLIFGQPVEPNSLKKYRKHI